MGMNLKELSDLFQRLGARDPAGWAASQLQEGIPQLERYLFLRQAWRSIVAEGDGSWIDACINESRKDPTKAYAGVGLALERLLAKGTAPEDLTDLVRGMQAQLLFHLCYLLEDPGNLERDVANVSWGLFKLDEQGQPTVHVNGLHESVLETDPSGREMRPRKVPG